MFCDPFVPLPPVANVGSNGLLNFASAVTDRIRSLIGPHPLHASASAFAPRRLGGLSGSFSNFGGAVFFESFEDGSPADWTFTGTVGTSAAAPNIDPTDEDAFGFMLTPGVDTGDFGGTGGSTWESSSIPALAGDVLSLDFNFMTTDGNSFNDFAYIQVINADTDVLVATIGNANTSGPSDQAVPALGPTPAPAISAGTLSPATSFFDGVLTGPIGTCPVLVPALSGCTPGGQTFGPGKFGGGAGGSTRWVTSTFTIPADGNYKLSFVVQDLLNRIFPSGLAIDNILVAAPVSPCPC